MKNAGIIFLTALILLICTGPAAGQSNAADSVRSSVLPALTHSDSLAFVYFIRRQQFIDSVVRGTGFRQDGLLQFDRDALALENLTQLPVDFFERRGSDIDYIGEDLARRQLNPTSFFDIGGLVRTAMDRLRPRPERRGSQALSRLPLPSPEEVAILNILWASGTSSGPQIYRRLPQDVPLTAEMLWKTLKKMADAGYIESRLISPQNVFTIVTPLISIPIEMSARNRKNRVYDYRPRVGKHTLQEYLESRRYLATLQADAAESVEYVRRIDRLLELLIRPEPVETTRAAPN